MIVTDVLKLLQDHPEESFLEFSPFNGHAFGTGVFATVTSIGLGVRI